ncbi:bacillithiol biosynthesis cysteine-adding enzyme BshC [Thermaerobacter sp. PB12/4term]|uniref:bacillithiol biosynthesis cysteine-adding enzyme BshC n=1 Tax=Thermaerobacter sp. PB12/4term TaxID=2293838 RepID=UPI001FABE0A3|nr:bacillithiol biosynthesis cysteine-adding enzyme BshC [Thermaerobacter sp. PB12/4term]
MQIQPLEQLEWVYPDFFVHYQRDFERVRPFFHYNPQDESAFARRAQVLERLPHRPPREAVAQALAAYNAALDAEEPALEAARGLADPRALVVVGGQQPGLATGPLYTVYKALGIIRWAQRLAGALNRPVVPVFWLATEDHDLAECNQLHMLDDRGRLHRLALPFPAASAGGQPPVGTLPLVPAARALIAEMARLAGVPAGHPVVKVLEDACQRSQNLGQWVGRLLARLFSRDGLVILDPMDPVLRCLSRPLFQRAVVRREAIHRELAAAAQRLQRRGYRPGLDVDPAHANLFYFDGRRRAALLWQDGRFADRHGRLAFSPADLARELERRPEAFSPNVVLRPLVQDWLLPVVGFVVGPGEALYLAQLRDVYPLFGLEMPVVLPRPGFTLVEPAAVERLGRYRATVGEVLADPAGLRRRVLQELDPVGIDDRFASLRQQFKDLYAALLDDLERVRPELRSLGQDNLGRILMQVDYLHRKTWQHHRRRQREAGRDLDWLEGSLRPAGQPQERVHNVFPYLMRYGERWLRSLLRAPWPGGHQLVFLDPPGDEPGTLPAIPASAHAPGMPPERAAGAGRYAGAPDAGCIDASGAGRIGASGAGRIASPVPAAPRAWAAEGSPAAGREPGAAPAPGPAGGSGR